MKASPELGLLVFYCWDQFVRLRRLHICGIRRPWDRTHKNKQLMEESLTFISQPHLSFAATAACQRHVVKHVFVRSNLTILLYIGS